MVCVAASFLPGQSSPLTDNSRREMVTDQVQGAEGGVESMYTIWDPGFWGLGWEVKGSKPRHWSGNKTSPDTWVHWGFAGTLCWFDPQRELGVAVFANRSVASGWMFRPARWVTMSDALCDVADGLA
jgi:CubicO group peptidase (beta-lactamase class C family)